MQVALVTGLKQIELREFPDPRPEPGKAVVQIACCGICGTDVHAFQSGAPYNPAICGHEWSGVVAHAASGAAVREGDRVAIGIAGATVLIEPQPARRALGGRLGATALVDPHAEDAAACIASITGRPGADVVFECAGIPSTIETAVTLARRGGVVSLVGVPSATSQINGAGWLVKEVRLVTSLGYQREEFEMTQALVRDGRVDLGALHTSTVGLADMADAFARLSDTPAEVKILVDPNR